MPTFGGYAPFPLRLGESKSAIKIINEALNASRGTALDCTERATPAWVENHAAARALADVWATNERLGLQTDMARTSALSRWEAFLGKLPTPGASDADRRRELLRTQQRFGAAVNYQAITDELAKLSSRVTFTLANTSSLSAGVISSDPGSYYVACSAVANTQPVTTSAWPIYGTTSGVSLTLSGTVTANVDVYVTFTTAGSFSGTGTGPKYSVTLVQSGTVTTLTGTIAAGGVALGSTGLTLSFGAGYYEKTYYFYGRAVSSAASKTPPAVTLQGALASDVDLIIAITSTGAVGTAGYTLVYTQGGVTTVVNATTASGAIAIGTTGLTLSFAAGTYTQGDAYISKAYARLAFTSTMDVIIVAKAPSDMTDADYFTEAARASSTLDQLLPAWATYHVVRDGSVAGSFVLDDSKPTLDNQRLSA